MTGTRILMVVKEAAARAAYEDALRQTGVGFDVADSFSELMRLSVDNAYSGLLVDILTLIRSSKEEKSIAYDCLNYYPSLRVKWDARGGRMILSPLEQSIPPDVDDTLSSFIRHRCMPFTARSLRRFARKETCLSLWLSAGAGCPQADSLKSFTVNVSLGGAFVHTTEPLAKGDTVWLRFVEIADEPVPALVCWRIEWGSCRAVPGAGVMFQDLTDVLRERIRKLAAL